MANLSSDDKRVPVCYFAVGKVKGIYYLDPNPMDFDTALDRIKSKKIFMAVPATDWKDAYLILSKRGSVAVLG